MALTLTTKIMTILEAVFADTAFDMATVQGIIQRSPTFSLASGVGLNQADLVYADTITLGPSATVTLDLAGALTDIFARVITFVKIKGIFIYALAANTNDVVMGAAVATQFLGPLGTATDTIHVKPGGMLECLAPTAAGWAVGAGASDNLKFANSAAGTDVTFDLILLGASA